MELGNDQKIVADNLIVNLVIIYQLATTIRETSYYQRNNYKRNNEELKQRVVYTLYWKQPSSSNITPQQNTHRSIFYIEFFLKGEFY